MYTNYERVGSAVTFEWRHLTIFQPGERIVLIGQLQGQAGFCPSVLIDASGVVHEREDIKTAGSKAVIRKPLLGKVISYQRYRVRKQVKGLPKRGKMQRTTPGTPNEKPHLVPESQRKAFDKAASEAGGLLLTLLLVEV